MARVPKKRSIVLAVAAVFGVAAGTGMDTPAIGPRGPVDWRGLPITFERNDGQHEAPVLFTSRGPHGILALRAGELAIIPRNATPGTAPARLKLAGAHPAPEVEPRHPLVTRSHYYTSASPVTDIPHFGELRMKDVYPGIDVELHGRGGSLEYDFVVAPGADPDDIRFDLRDADRAWIDGEGNLRLDFRGQALMQRKPVAYQERDGRTDGVDARFTLAKGATGTEARIALGDYDRSATLIVDPVIAYSTYVGSSGNDGPASVRADPSSGAVYFAQVLPPSVIAVTKLDPGSNAVLYQTYVGGSGSTGVADTALAADGAFYVAGFTSPPGYGSPDAYVMRIGASGSLDAVRYIGGSGSDQGDYALGVALDGAGNVYVAGETFSSDLPITTGQEFNLGIFGMVGSDGFAAKLTPNLAGTYYLRYVGGSGDDHILDVAVDSAGQAVVVGVTTSTSLSPAGAAFAPQFPPTCCSFRGFATRLSADGTAAIYSQYIGGQSSSANRVAIDPYTGDAVIGGFIDNSNLSPPSARPFSGNEDAFLVRVRGDGLPLWASYLGGSGGYETIGAVAVDGSGAIYIAGSTTSIDFPLVAPLAGIQPSDDYQVYVSRFRNGALDFSTQLGSSGGYEYATSLSLGSSGSVFVGGYTNSPDFPTVNALRSFRSGPSDGFVTKIGGLGDRRAEFMGDFNGDGKADVLWQHADGSTQMWLMDGGSMLSFATLRAGATGWRVSAVGDFSGDGRADIVWTHPDGSSQMWVMTGTTQAAQSTIQGPGSGWSVAQVADFNGDGRADILWEHRNGATELWTMTKGFAHTTATLRVAGAGWRALHVADFNGDGRADILWQRESDGATEIWLMNGSSTLEAAPLNTGGYGPGSHGWIPTHTGDFNGDGKADILWRHANGSTMMHLMNGTSVESAPTLTPPGSGLRATHVGDLNGDGRADILWRGRGGGLAYWMMNGATAIASAQITNPANSRWVPRRIADFAGDRRYGMLFYDRGTTRMLFVNPDGSLRVSELRSSGSPWTAVGFDE